MCGGMISRVKPSSAQLLADHDPRGELGERHADHLADERHGARGARVDLEDVDVVPLIANWTFISPITPSSCASAITWRRTSSSTTPVDRVGGQRAGAVAGVHAGALDVLHDAGDDDRLAVADRVDVELDRVLEELVDQHRTSRPDLDGAVHVAAQRRPRRRRSPSRGRRARRTAAPAPDSRCAAPPRPPRRRSARCRSAAGAGRAGRAAPRSAGGPRRGRWRRARCR